MNRKSFTLAFLLVAVALALTVTTWSGAQPADNHRLPGINLAGKDPALVGLTGDTKRADGIPSAPAIVDAVLHTGTVAGAADDTLWVVFNQDVALVDFGPEDFLFNRGTFGDSATSTALTLAYHSANNYVMGGGMYMNVIAITGLNNITPNLVAANWVSLKNPLAITNSLGTGEFVNGSKIPIRTGPAITKAIVTGGGADTPINDNAADQITVLFSHRMNAATFTPANARADFAFPELGTTGNTPTSTMLNSPENYGVLIDWNDNLSQNKVRAGITWVRVAAVGAVGATAGGTNTAVRAVCTVNEGPRVLRASYDAGSASMTLVMSDDIDPDNVVGLGNTAFSITGGVTYTALQDANDGDNVLRLGGLSGSPIGQTVNINDPSQITDHQGNPGVFRAAAPVTTPIITLANFDDGGSAGFNRINVWFDQTISVVPSLSNFGFVGVTTDANTQVTLPVVGSRQIQIINPVSWTQGARIFFHDVPFTTDLGTSNPDTTGWAWVRDGSEPLVTKLAQNLILTADVSDTQYVGIDQVLQGGSVDDAAYAMIYSRRQLAEKPPFSWVVQNQDAAGVLIDPDPANTANLNLILTTAIDTLEVDSQGDSLQPFDLVYFWGVVVDKEGNWDPNQLFALGSGVAGPLGCPRDTLPGDQDAIHVFGTDLPGSNEHIHYVCGDPGSAPQDADSVRAYAADDRSLFLGSAVVNSDGSWGPILLNPDSLDSLPLIWLVSVQNTGAVALESMDICPYINDIAPPLAKQVFDPLNGLKCYSPGDTVRLLVQTCDPYDDGDTYNDTARNSLLHVWADLSELVTTPGADSVNLVSLGANLHDDDNDWIDTDDDDVVDFPEPYVDENGNGIWDPGETFVDLDLAGYTDGVYDAGDANLDSNDPDEFGWYYLKGYYLNPADFVADANGAHNFATLEDVPITVYVEDNFARSNNQNNLAGGGDFANNMNVLSGGSGSHFKDPFTGDCITFSLEHRNSNDDCTARLDAARPSVSEISFLETIGGYRGESCSECPNSNDAGTPGVLGAASGPAGCNLILPGDHCYTLPAGEVSPYFNLADSTLSDDDVTLVALQIDPEGDGTFVYLSFDPAGDANGDGAPGLAGWDDDDDGLADFEDMQVRIAMADSVTALNEGLGAWVLTDNRDNDNDAFFRLNPITGRYLWFNVDERNNNGIDDNGDGIIDNEPNETYNPAFDDDEDGIVDGSAVEISYDSDQRINRIGSAGSMWVAGFSDPAQIAKYKGTPTHTNPDYIEANNFVSTWPNDLVNTQKLLVSGNLDFWPNKYEIHSIVLNGADNLSAPWFAKGAPNIISAGGWSNGAIFDPEVVLSGFNYLCQNGHALNMRTIKYLYGIPDGHNFGIRAVAFDACFQGNPAWAVPLCLQTDETVPDADIDDSDFGGQYAEVCDVIATDNDNDGHLDPASYVLNAPVPAADQADLAFVRFEQWDENTLSWFTMIQDASPPYQATFNVGDLYPNGLPNDPPDFRDTVYFRAVAVDIFGNTEPITEDDATCDTLVDSTGAPCFELALVLVDCQPPASCICQVGADYYPADGAAVPAEQAVDISAWFTDGDENEDTNDVTRVLFQYRPAGTNTWLTLNSLTGTLAPGDSLVDVTGIHHAVIETGPDTLKVTVTWDTRDLPAGAYDLRAVVEDVEGNNNDTMACIVTATLDNVGLRAYIQPCVMTSDVNTDSLFANVYIHDVAVQYVRFEFFEDANGDGVDNDGGSAWVPINTIGDEPGERCGDVILRAGWGWYYKVKQGVYHALNTYDPPGTGTRYLFWDVDGDGYNPVDPVVRDSGNGIYDGAADPIVVSTDIAIPVGTVLTAFAPSSIDPGMSEYFVDMDGDGLLGDNPATGQLEDQDWILKNNPLNGPADAQIDLWCTPWDKTGLAGCFLVRAVARDALGNTDDDEDGNGIPDSSPTEIWTEQCCFDTDIASFCVTSYADENGVVTELGAGECPSVPANDSLFVYATISDFPDADVDSVRFDYSIDGGATWHNFGTDFFGPEWSAVFPYAKISLPSDILVNFRATGYRGGYKSPDPNSCKACLVLSENKGPETDIVLIWTDEGDTLDTNTVLRGSLNPLCLEPTTLHMLVTAEDNSGVDNVWFMFRKVAGETPADTTVWMKVTTGIVPTDDSKYPYEFDWDIAAVIAQFGNGVYQFFPRGIDPQGNVTPTFGNPFRFATMDQAASVATVEKNGAAVSSLTPGEEVVIKGVLDDPSDNVGVVVKFYYAERIDGESLTLSANPPYYADTDHTIYSNSTAGEHGSEKVWVNGVQATYIAPGDISDLDQLSEYTIIDGNTLRFGAKAGAADVITIDYDATVCKPIGEDDDAPYSVAWDADNVHGVVPSPTPGLGTTSYDMIASAYRIYRYKGGSYTTCEEPCVSEMFILPLNDTEAPDFLVHGLLCKDSDGEGNFCELYNAPGNPLCTSCGGNDLVGLQGDCKCKLSGIEHQIFVTGDLDPETNDLFTVQMSVGGNAGVDFERYTAEEDTTITIPITFDLKTQAREHVGDFKQAVNPDSVENVTIDVPGIGVFNTAMTPVGDGWYRYDAVLPIPESGVTDYGYVFHVDLVGNDFIDTDDPCWEGSTISIPAEFWAYDIEDPASFWGVNTIDQVRFMVTDEAGNMSTNLQSGSCEGAAGQIWMTYDPTHYEVDNFWISDDVVGPGAYVFVNVEVGDNDGPATADVVRLDHVIVQVAVDDTHARWRTWFTDWKDQHLDGPFYTDNGGWGGEYQLPSWMNPAHDGIDNDRDGYTDENDTEKVGNGISEETYTYTLRAVTVDDCCNYGYSCGPFLNQAEAICVPITVDAGVPQACLTAPADGSIHVLGEVIDLAAETSDTDVAYVVFQYNFGNGWHDIDCTPFNDHDDNDANGYGVTANEDGSFTCSWDTNFLARELASDFYVRMRAVAVDKVDNRQSDDSDLDCDINIVMNDVTGPVAAIMQLQLTQCEDTKLIQDPTLAVSGDICVGGVAVGFSGYDVATVVLQMSFDNQSWQTIGVQNEFERDFFEPQVQWNICGIHTDPWPEGMVWFRAYATDADGNIQNDADGDGVSDKLVAVGVMVDHTAPEADLVQVGPISNPQDGDLIQADLNPDVVEICDNLDHGITFRAASQDVAGDVEIMSGVVLQMYSDVTPNLESGHWITIHDFEYRDFSGNNQNPDGQWVLHYNDIDDFYDDIIDAFSFWPGGYKLQAKEYRFRVLGTDYACNVNEDSEGILLRLDHITPEVGPLFAGDKFTEGGAGENGYGQVHVAGGDDVRLRAVVDDRPWDTYQDGGGFGGHDLQHESSGMWAVQFAVKPSNSSQWRVLGTGTFDDNGTEDFYKDDTWYIDWTTPMNMPSATDSTFDVRVIARDNAGNSNCPYGYTVNGMVIVQDVTPPEDTKLAAVSGESCDTNRGSTYPWVYIDEKPGDGVFGYLKGIDEANLNQDLTGAKVLGTVSRTAILYAATPQGDASMGVYSDKGGVTGVADNGYTGFEATVFFEGRRAGSTAWIPIGQGQCWANCVGQEVYPEAPGVTDAATIHRGPIWALEWNTLAQDANGNYIWFDPAQDGTQVQIRAYARDTWGNVETITNDAIYRLVVDNTAPSITVNVVDAKTLTAVTTVERNNPNGLIIDVNRPVTGNHVNDDVVVSFYYKLATDLDESGSWVFLDPKNGIKPTDDNPDNNRPFSFHWNTNKHRDPQGDPLIPNTSYDVSADVSDLVCNTTPVAGTAKSGHAYRIKFVDTIAPQATITWIQRELDEGDCRRTGDPGDDWVENPEDVRVNKLKQIWAQVLDGASDAQDVKFYYRPVGGASSTWVLIDTDVSLKDLDNDDQAWYIEQWSTAPLAEGPWELLAVGTDDAGNTDANPPHIRIIVDRTGPTFTAVTPKNDQIWVPENIVNGEPFPSAIDECDPDKRVADLIVTSPDHDIAYSNSWNNCVRWQWKESSYADSDNEWSDIDDAMTLFDGKTGRFSATADLLAGWGDWATLIDIRVVATDEAGNSTRTIVARKVIVDNVDPNIEITHFDIDGNVDTTIDPIDNGQITDVSHGDQVKIYATVNDDEIDLPASHETKVSEVQFFVRYQYDNNWKFLGTAGFNAVTGLWGVTWNTTGLTSTGRDEDVYYITAYATDEAANCGEAHSWVEVHITNQAIPLAQVSAFNPDLLSVITKGTNDRVYGLTFGEKEAATVFFQYRQDGVTDWTTVGIGEYTGETLTTRQASLIDQDLWYSAVRSSNWAAGTILEFRAVATDQSVNPDVAKPGNGELSKNTLPGQGGATPAGAPGDLFSGLYDLDNTPILRMTVSRADDGSTYLTPSDNLGYITGVTFTPGCTIDDSRITVTTTNPLLAPFVVVVGEDGTGRIDEFIPEMDRMVDDHKVWVSNDNYNNGSYWPPYIDPVEGAIVNVYATAHLKRTSPESPAPQTQMMVDHLNFYQVTNNRGTNGTVGVDGNGAKAADGYPTDAFAIRVPAGAIDAGKRYGLLVKRTDMPNTPEWQADQIQGVGATAYQIGLFGSHFSSAFANLNQGYEADVWLRYGNEVDEDGLSVGSFGDGWQITNITNVVVDTTANVIKFRLKALGNGSCPVTIGLTSTKQSPYQVMVSPNWNGWTDQDPIIRGIIDLRGNNLGDLIELKIDGALVFSTAGSSSGGDWWFKYPGSYFQYNRLDYDTNGDLNKGKIAWEYQHTCTNNDALPTGPHTVEISVELANDEENYMVSSGTHEFKVDSKAPYIEFHGGFVGNPRLRFAAGYIDLADSILTVKMWDKESGLLFREDRIDDFEDAGYGDQCAELDQDGLCDMYYSIMGVSCDEDDLISARDRSFKYDVWVIDDCGSCGNADQQDIDEMEERTLLYTGTADALAPYVTPSLDTYTPGDTLNVPLAVLTGGHRVKDGAVIEITLYSEKMIMPGEPTVDGNIQDFLDALRAAGLNFKFDANGQEYVVYLRGPQDCVFNVGSRFTEQRFIVDGTPPGMVPTDGRVVCGGDPTESIPQAAGYTFRALFDDDGSGVDPSDVTVEVSGPDGFSSETKITEAGVEVTFSASEGDLMPTGLYTVVVSGTDRLGNAFASVCSFRMGSETLGLSNARVYPNPFNPGNGDASIAFTLPKAATVTVRIYDWSGNYVAQVAQDALPAGSHVLKWGGQSNDGTALGNGVYLVRIVADDGTRQERSVVKVALWNER